MIVTPNPIVAASSRQRFRDDAIHSCPAVGSTTSVDLGPQPRLLSVLRISAPRRARYCIEPHLVGTQRFPRLSEARPRRPASSVNARSPGAVGRFNRKGITMGRLERMIATQPNGPDIAAKALRAMTGDADAAFFVSRYLTYGERLDWALDLFRVGALTASRRVVLDKWSLDHDGIVGDAARLRCFYGLITATRHLDRNIAALPETVTLWRGQPAADDTTGLSWTFDRDVALFFATTWRHSPISRGLPVVLLRREVRRERVLACISDDYGREYQEAILYPARVVRRWTETTLEPGTPETVATVERIAARRRSSRRAFGV